jgi:hypothetical protein
MDALVRRYIHENLSYRFVILMDGKAANALEAKHRIGNALFIIIAHGICIQICKIIY